jgi:hypothetical protein
MAPAGEQGTRWYDATVESTHLSLTTIHTKGQQMSGSTGFSEPGTPGGVLHNGASEARIERAKCVRESPRRVDPDLAADVAGCFQAARNDYTDPIVCAAYHQLERQSDAIFAQLTDADHRLDSGLRVEFTRCESPYQSDDEMVGAVRSHRTLEITTSARERDRRHPLLGCDLGGAYDRFRAVHDIVGHVGPRLGFDRNGEFAAWLTQEQLYDGLARWALATELHAEHSVRWTTGTLSEHKATLIDLDLLLRVRNASTAVKASTPLPSSSLRYEISKSDVSTNPKGLAEFDLGTWTDAPDQERYV